MAIEITKTFVVNAPPSRVWDFLVDLQQVARCMPGAAITEKLDDRTYAGTMTVKVGPVSASYRGRIVFERLDAGARTAEIVATGQDVRGRGGADMRLTSSVAERDGATEVTAVSRLNVTGMLAQLGRGMVEDVGDQIFQMFSQRVRTELESGATATATPTPTPNSSSNSSSNSNANSNAGAGASGSPLPLAPAGERGGGEGASPTANAVASGEGVQRTGLPQDSALDLGEIGTKVAGRAAARTLNAPTPMWLTLLLVALVVYLLFR
jgi:carbon monoxide dehydrogenase subunit G